MFDMMLEQSQRMTCVVSRQATIVDVGFALVVGGEMGEPAVCGGAATRIDMMNADCRVTLCSCHELTSLHMRVHAAYYLLLVV